MEQTLEQLVAELKRILTFKDDTEEGDLVLVAAQEPHLLVYARVGPIDRDETKRDEWWHVTLHFLGMPIQTAVWTLREPQFTGREIFTMGGNPHFIKALDFRGLKVGAADPEPETPRGPRFTRVK